MPSAQEAAMPSLATFNANNFFLRYRFANTFPGDQSRKSLVEAAEVAGLGYIPGKLPESATRNARPYDRQRFVVWDEERRVLAAQALAEPEGALPDILCLQEVENLDAVRVFNDRYLGNHYPYLLLVDGHDVRNIDVAVLSRFPFQEIRTHMDLRDGEERVFSRDCLEVVVDLPRSKPLVLFVTHLKSKFTSSRKGETAEQLRARRAEGHAQRLREARTILGRVQARMSGQRGRESLLCLVGDFNDVPHSPHVAPLFRESGLVDLLSLHRPEDCWTYYWRGEGQVSQIDHVLASPALARRVAQQVAQGRGPHVERAGLGYREINRKGEVLPATVRWVRVDEDAPDVPDAPPESRLGFRFPRYEPILEDLSRNISDHCPVKIWF